mgnify:CR=1 FL=1
METQALGRVHRIGQARETHFAKVIVKDTVDEQLMALRAKKKTTIGQALQNGTKQKMVPSIEELMQLFGDCERDHADEMTEAAVASMEDSKKQKGQPVRKP